MKRCIILLTAALMMLTTSLDAQSSRNSRPSRPTRPTHHRPHYNRQPGTLFFDGFGINFGYTNSSYRHLDLAADEPISSAMLHGFTVGLTKDVTLLPDSFYFQFGVNYIFQNDNRDENLNELKIRLIGDREEHYLAIPVRLKFNLPLVPDIGLTIDAGPTMLIGLSSKFNYRTRLSDKTAMSSSYNIFNGKVESYGSSPVFNLEQWMADSGMFPYGKVGRFDVMLGASAGAHFFEILEARVGYDWGLINRYKGSTSEIYSLRRGQFTLSLGVRF